MNFLAILVRYNWTFGGACIGAQYNAILEYDAGNRGARLHSTWWLKAALE